MVAFIEEAIELMLNEADMTEDEREEHKGAVTQKLQKKFINEYQKQQQKKKKGVGNATKARAADKVRTTSIKMLSLTKQMEGFDTILLKSKFLP